MAALRVRRPAAIAMMDLRAAAHQRQAQVQRTIRLLPASATLCLGLRAQGAYLLLTPSPCTLWGQVVAIICICICRVEGQLAAAALVAGRAAAAAAAMEVRRRHLHPARSLLSEDQEEGATGTAVHLHPSGRARLRERVSSWPLARPHCYHAMLICSARKQSLLLLGA